MREFCQYKIQKVVVIHLRRNLHKSVNYQKILKISNFKLNCTEIQLNSI